VGLKGGFNLFQVALSIVLLIVTILVGVLVLIRNIHNPINRYFGAVVFCSSFWILSNLMVDVVKVESLSMFWSKATIVGPIFLAPFFLIFAIYFPFTYPKISKLIKTIIFVPTLAFLSLVPTNLNIKSIQITASGVNVQTGSLYVYFLIYFAIFLSIAFIILLKKYFKSSGIVKTQIRYMFWGASLSAAIGFFVNGILLFLGHWEYASLGPLSIVFLMLFTAYAIVKHKMMDIRLVVARSLAYAILVAILAGFYAVSVLAIERIFFPSSLNSFDLTQGIIRTILAVIMAFSFQPLRKWITKVTDKIFFKNQYDPEQLLDTLSHTIGSSIVLIELVYKTLDLLMDQMKITRGIFVILNENGTIYNSQYSGYKVAPQVKHEDMEKLGKDGVLIFDELEEGSHYKNLLRKYDVSVSVPLKTDSGAEGILLLGEKASGDMFSQNDMKVFEIIAPELAVAITNAKSFEKIEKFNVTLRQEVKKATSELEKKNEQLRELDKAKDEFISMASHQLRTPLTAIKGYLSMLLEGDAGEIKVSQYDFVNEAFSGANRMVGLINDLLNVSRMETGRFFLEPVEVDMEKLVAEEVKQLENHAKEKKLYLKYEISGKTPHIWADETKIRQVVMNFIDNALYYTTEGGVKVTLDHDKTDVIFKVEDTGIGVPKEQQKNLFTKFYRADNARHVRPDGTGLGIYLAKRVMDDHCGTVLFHSVEGKGSTFGFKIPIKSKLKIKRASAPAPSQTTTPPVGELAAGIGVPPEALEATTQKPVPEIPNGPDIDIAKAAGIEPPLPDSSDAEDIKKTAEHQRESVNAASDAKNKL
jgi:signal transduction histidine kinase